MAELTKIFTGMEKGPEAIQANFDLMNSKMGSIIKLVKVKDV